MIGLGFCSMGGANNPVCWSYIPHQTEGELVYTVTYREMERATIALLTANVDKECEFTRYLKHLLAEPNIQIYMRSQDYQVSKFPIDHVQCDHQAGWHNLSVAVFDKLPNICSNISPVNIYSIPI